MNKLKERLVRFMAGRYGTDHLNNCMIVSAFVLMILGLFIPVPMLTALFNIALIFLVFFSSFRTYSRNIGKRRIENQKFRKITKPLRRGFSITKMKIREIKSHRFRTCPSCSVVIRTSTDRGPRSLTCPRCKTKFETRIYL